MPQNKVYATCDEAVQDVFDGAVVLFGGFAAPGIPVNLIQALLRRGTKSLTAVCNGATGDLRGFTDVSALVAAGQVAKLIASFPVSGSPKQVGAVEEMWRKGLLEVEIVPQGTLVERMRAAGAGIGGFWVRTGIGTPFEEGKERRVFDGEEYILERPLHGDFAFVKAHKADTFGNLVYRKAARNYNPVIATAARVTVAEVEEIVGPGELDAELVATPQVYVDRLVEVGKRA
ncbi:MAG: 3-oxoacid CoA-transferase subunit A [Chloroflexi bacterium]|nr:3-oxoacid CoA-transferase subunit A [Chloroflexota bacterium]